MRQSNKKAKHWTTDPSKTSPRLKLKFECLSHSHSKANGTAIYRRDFQWIEQRRYKWLIRCSKAIK